MAEAVTIARPYAVAAFRLAKENNALAAWSDMLGFAAAVAADAQMRAYIDDPKVASSDIERVFLSVCGNKLNAPGTNLVKLLVEYGRMSILPDIASAFEDLKAEDEGAVSYT